MSDYKRIESFDTIILDQISEEQIAQWMAAKLCIMRKTLPVSCVSITANFRDYRKDEHYDVSWGAHAADKCTGTQPDTQKCMEHLKQELLDNPRQRASTARSTARMLMKEAEELEALAVG